MVPERFQELFDWTYAQRQILCEARCAHRRIMSNHKIRKGPRYGKRISQEAKIDKLGRHVAYPHARNYRK